MFGVLTCLEAFLLASGDRVSTFAALLWGGLLTVACTLYQGTMAAGETSNQDNDRDMSPDNEPADTLQEVRTKEEGQWYIIMAELFAITMLFFCLLHREKNLLCSLIIESF